jgi:hypothetical protein
MTEPQVRIIPHEGVDSDCGSFEVRVSVWFYWENNPGRRLRPEQMTQEQAKAAAQEFARKESK